MEMPALLPFSLQKYLSLKTESELFDELKKQKETLIAFFQLAAEDEVWSQNHNDFITKVLQFLTYLAFENSLSEKELKEIQETIIAHPKLIQILPLDLIFEVEGKEIPVNTILFKAVSAYFSDSIQNQCKNKNNKIVLSGISLDFFKIIEEFAETYDVVDLWKKDQTELKEMRNSLTRFKMDVLGSLCETVLKRYIDRENVVTTLIEAHKNGWQVLRDASFEYINSLSFGIFFHPAKPSILAFEFLDFNERSLTVFDAVKNLITHLIGRKKIPESIEFKNCLQKCPSLIQLNISTSLKFTEFIFAASDSLEELDLSSCVFLDASILGHILSYFKNLKFLNLSDNSQLNYSSFSHLAKLKELIRLNISKNPQIHDDDFKLIVQSVRKLIDLDCSFCKNIGDSGFFELGKELKHLIFLNLSRDEISDGLLIELGSRSLFLEEINLAGCNKITGRGILEFVKQARALKQLTIDGDKDLLLKINQAKPHLRINLSKIASI